MLPEQIAIFILLGSFFFLILSGVHIVFAVGIATIATSWYLEIPLMVVAQNMVKGINVFSLLAVPFFIIAGEIMGSGGISNRLIALSNALVGWIRGGLAMVNIVASMFFGGISGSASADVASIGVILIPMMKEQGYDAEFSAGVTLASSIQGILIPPSHNMIIFALAAGGVSIAKLFLAGMVPGIVLGVALMIYSYVVSVKRNYPIVGRFNPKTAVRVFYSSLPGLITVFIVVVGVIGGIFTATESSAVAVVYAFFITFFVFREIPLREFPNILARCIKPLAITMMLIGTATAFGWMMAYLEVPSMMADFILGISSNKIVILLIINLLLLFLGTIMNMVSIIIILTPILLPIVTSLGMDVVHFGIMMIFNLGIGLLTPPVGAVLFIGSAISGIKLETLSKAMLPFYIVMIVTLLIITFVPEIVMFFPNLFLPD